MFLIMIFPRALLLWMRKSSGKFNCRTVSSVTKKGTIGMKCTKPGFQWITPVVLSDTIRFGAFRACRKSFFPICWEITRSALALKFINPSKIVIFSSVIPIGRCGRILAAQFIILLIFFCPMKGWFVFEIMALAAA